jgi:hypothetical protein
MSREGIGRWTVCFGGRRKGARWELGRQRALPVASIVSPLVYGPGTWKTFTYRQQQTGLDATDSRVDKSESATRTEDGSESATRTEDGSELRENRGTTFQREQGGAVDGL